MDKELTQYIAVIRNAQSLLRMNSYLQTAEALDDVANFILELRDASSVFGEG